ncbi:MAG: hypothetical protein AAF849_08290 [Bacteroidota bacterium]
MKEGKGMMNAECGTRNNEVCQVGLIFRFGIQTTFAQADVLRRTRYSFLLCLCLFGVSGIHAQAFEAGAEYTFGRTYTTFKGNLSDIVGFSELEITEADIDTAFASFDLNAPRWVKDLFPGLRIEIDQEIAKQLSRGNRAARFYGRFQWVGASFMISEPRLTEQLASKILSNQLRSIRLAVGGRTEELSAHLADIALEETQQVKPFFPKRYDLEVYLHLKKMLLGNEPLLEWGNNSYLDAELTTGLRLTADPSPVVELGSILFISEKIDSLLEGGLLRAVENTTDEIAEAIQSSVFGKFKDPRIISSMGWFARGTLPLNFGQNFSLVAGAEVSVSKHLMVSGTNPMFSFYGFGGLRWNWKSSEKARRRRR